MHRVSALLAVMLSAAPSLARAQVAADFTAAIGREVALELREGDARSVRGILHAVESDTTFVARPGEMLRIPLAAVRRAEVNAGTAGGEVRRGVLRGAVIGAVIGIGVGVAESRDQDGDGQDDPGATPSAQPVAVGLGVGALLGALIGGIVEGWRRETIWEPIVLTRRDSVQGAARETRGS